MHFVGLNFIILSGI